MDLSLPIGLSVASAAYGATWFFIVKSNRIIHNISKKNLKTTREIQKELEL